MRLKVKEVVITIAMFGAVLAVSRTVEWILFEDLARSPAGWPVAIALATLIATGVGRMVHESRLPDPIAAGQGESSGDRSKTGNVSAKDHGIAFGNVNGNVTVERNRDNRD
ncbi:hypothetical protein [Micromonospora tulbaghiae]|uniref:hypothetical protein n=1 Tax=Micromonospora tulbaghiae TaxID=479978 RepID=UPI00340EF2DE